MASPYSAYEIKHARINATSDGDNTIVSNSDVDKAIVVLSYALNVNAAGVVQFQDSAGSAVVNGSFEFVDGGGASYAGSPDAPAFKLAKGVGLEVNTAAGVDALGHVTYVLAGRS